MESPIKKLRCFFTRIKITVITALLGLYFSIGGVWLLWDLTNYLYHNPIYQNNIPLNYWRFYYPLYIGYVTPDNWSLAFDVGAVMVLLVGIPLLVITGYEVRKIEKETS
jgi:hypothetical protein